MSEEKAKYQFTANVNWPAERILEALKVLDGRMDMVEKRQIEIRTLLVGVENTDEHGVIGSVHELFKSRNDFNKDIAAINTRCDMEHGKDPGGKKKESTVWQFVMENKKSLIPVIIVVFTAGTFTAGVIIELVKKSITLRAVP